MLGHGMLMAAGGGGAISARIWRLNVTASADGGAYMNILEIDLRESAGGINACNGSGGTASESSAYSSVYTSKEAFFQPHPSGTTYFWHSASQTAPWWAKFDFGPTLKKSIMEVSITGANIAGRQPKDFSIDYSDDGVTWKTRKSFSGVTGWVIGTPKVFSLI